MNGKRCGTLTHADYPGVGQICGDIHFDIECFTNQKTQAGDGKCNLFSSTLELGHALGIFQSKEKDSVMAHFYKHVFSIEYKHEILGEKDKALIQQLYGKPKSVEAKVE